jgi:hypothetical protein
MDRRFQRSQELEVLHRIVELLTEHPRLHDKLSASLLG